MPRQYWKAPLGLAAELIQGVLESVGQAGTLKAKEMLSRGSIQLSIGWCNQAFASKVLHSGVFPEVLLQNKNAAQFFPNKCMGDAAMAEQDRRVIVSRGEVFLKSAMMRLTTKSMREDCLIIWGCPSAMRN